MTLRHSGPTPPPSEIPDRASTRGATRADGVALIAAERQRQITEEGWTPDHDDRHNRRGQLADAAACYAATEPVYRVAVSSHGVGWREPWPYQLLPETRYADDSGSYAVPWRRPEADRIRQLVKAGALIAAEIDRLARVGLKAKPEASNQESPA